MEAWGFESLADDSMNDLTLNIAPFRNEFSPFSNADSLHLGSEKSGRLLVDRYYGLAYDPWDETPEAIYGRTEALPNYVSDKLANMGFLRVPFRKIPRVRVSSRIELYSILDAIFSADDDLRVLFRGQTKEHYISRTTEAMKALYGDPEALEPSLQPSSARRGPDFEASLPEWYALLQVFADTQLKTTKSGVSLPSNEAEDARRWLFSTPRYWNFGLAMAQHYGLPSPGLDATTDPEVALFFALNRIELSPEERPDYRCVSISSSSEPSVLYILTPPSSAELDYQEIRPKGFASVRPERQSVHFIPTGWGMQRNAAAFRLFMALYFYPSDGLQSTATAEDLFPSTNEDPFALFLSQIVEQIPAVHTQTLLRDFRWNLQKR